MRFAPPGGWNNCTTGCGPAWIVSMVKLCTVSALGRIPALPQACDPQRVAIGAADACGNGLAAAPVGLAEGLGRDDAVARLAPGQTGRSMPPGREPPRPRPARARACVCSSLGSTATCLPCPRGAVARPGRPRGRSGDAGGPGNGCTCLGAVGMVHRVECWDAGCGTVWETSLSAFIGFQPRWRLAGLPTHTNRPCNCAPEHHPTRIALATQVAPTAPEKQKSDLLRGRLFCGCFANLLICTAICLVAWDGIEPPTQGFSILCSTD